MEGVGSEPGGGQGRAKFPWLPWAGMPLNNKSNLDPLQRPIGPPQPHQAKSLAFTRGDAG